MCIRDSLREAIKQSCDTYFYEAARLLGVDRLNETAKKFGLGEKVFNNMFIEEKKGVVPSTKWKKEVIGENWYLGETLINGIGQGYIQTTPLQLCLMTAQLANGGFKIFPKLVIEKNQKTYEQIKYAIDKNLEDIVSELSQLIPALVTIFKSNVKLCLLINDTFGLKPAKITVDTLIVLQTIIFLILDSLLSEMGIDVKSSKSCLDCDT